MKGQSWKRHAGFTDQLVLPSPPAKPPSAAALYSKEYRAKRLQDPAYRERVAAANAKYEAKRRADPAFRAARSAYDKEYRKRQIFLAREPEYRRRAEARAVDPVVRAHRQDISDAYRFGSGIVEWRREIFMAQDGRCANPGCRKSEAENGKRLAIDHDHDCPFCGGKSCPRCWRGLLCASCNYVEGHMRGSNEVLHGLVDYIAAHRDRLAAEKEAE